MLPLNNDTFARALAPRPSATAGKTVFTYTGVNPGIPIQQRTEHPRQVVHDHRRGRCAAGRRRRDDRHHGRTLGRLGLYLLKGKPVFDYNMLILAQYRWEGPDALTPGKHTIVFDYTYDGPGIAKGGTGVLKVDGKVVATGKQANSIAFLQVADETFDVGVDTRTGVNDKDYQVPFAFNGTIDKLTVNLGPMQLTQDDQQKLQRAAAVARD